MWLEMLRNFLIQYVTLLLIWFLIVSLAYVWVSLRRERRRILPFSEVLDGLQKWEKNEKIELVSAWNDRERTAVSKCFEAAWEKGKFAEKEYRLPRFYIQKNGKIKQITNQKIGTDIWNAFREELEAGLDDYKFESCEHTGYPDKRLVSNTGKNYAFEEKATSGWDDKNDGLRMVICSSTTRLRKTFEPPINHIWALLYYGYRFESEECVCTLYSLQLHFPEPQTPVTTKMEIATSKKILGDAVENKDHKKVSFGTLPE